MSEYAADFIQGTSPDFSQVKQALSACKATVGPAELHGMICGVICVERQQDSKTWLEPVLESTKINHKKHDVNIAVLTDLYDFSWQQIHAMEFNFQLLLPVGSGATLTKRAQALSEWCHGFLYSLGINDKNWKKLQKDAELTSENEEILQHLTEIVKLDYEELTEGEEEETAFTDLVEYLRMSVLMLYYNLHQEVVKGKSIITSHRKTLH